MDIRELGYTAIALRVVLAILIGGLIGLERETKNQPAGGRTYMLVCLGACMVMMTNQYICSYFGGGDPSRLGAQVISGIGFLGAGTILVTRNNQVRGLTTAAGLWSAACIGLAIGIGFYEGAVIVGIVLFLIMTVFKKIDDKVQRNSKYIRVYLNFSSGNAMNSFMKQCREGQIKIVDMQISKLKNDSKNGIAAQFTLKNEHRQEHAEVIRNWSEIEGVKYIEEI